MKNSKKNGTDFSPEEKRNALHMMQDLGERLGGMPWYPFGETGKSIDENWLHSVGEKSVELEGNEIHVGVKASEFTEQRKSMFETLKHLMGYDIEAVKGGYRIKLGGVPVFIQVIERNYKFLDNPNIVFWGATEFLMPNPFNSYWKIRKLVK